MGFLSFFSKEPDASLDKLPSGSFTVDRNGKIIASTLPHDFPASRTQAIGNLVLATFRSAREADLHLTELVADYSAFKLTAKELRGGAMVFLTPLAFGSRSSRR